MDLKLTKSKIILKLKSARIIQNTFVHVRVLEAFEVLGLLEKFEKKNSSQITTFLGFYKLIFKMSFSLKKRSNPYYF